LVASADEILKGAGKEVVLGNKPVWVIQDKRGNYKALSAICTHLGCIVEWQQDKQIFFCPCHAGVFDDNGRVISGPPPRPLPEYGLKIKDGRVYLTGLKEGERLYGA
jgi:cytochrome b6-f complex iron-sulfur subunit